MSGGTKNVHIRRGSQGWRRTNVLYTHNTELKEISSERRHEVLLNQKWGDFVPEAKSRQVGGLSYLALAPRTHY